MDVVTGDPVSNGDGGSPWMKEPPCLVAGNGSGAISSAGLFSSAIDGSAGDLISQGGVTSDTSFLHHHHHTGATGGVGMVTGGAMDNNGNHMSNSGYYNSSRTPAMANYRVGQGQLHIYYYLFIVSFICLFDG